MRYLVFVVFIFSLLLASSAWLSRPIFQQVFSAAPVRAMTMAPLDQAITLARSIDGEVLVVTAVSAEGVSAVSLDDAAGQLLTDAVAAYQALGRDELRRQALNAGSSHRFTWEQLTLPVDSPPRQVAAGTNFVSHAQEVGHEGEPFLFPKLSAATAWNAAVVNGVRLDYEIELCAVPLRDVHVGEQPQLGYLLCNDFTDRWLLVRDIDLDGQMGESGFPLAKGGETRLPIGPLLVIPDSDAFYQQIELQLYVDDQLRQRASAGLMVWSPAQVIARALADCRDNYDLQGRSIALGACERLAAGTLVLTGTPEGVIFHPATIWSPWAYLRSGQTIHAYGSYLGQLRNVIVPD